MATMGKYVTNIVTQILIFKGGIGFLVFYVIMGCLIFSLIFMQHVFIKKGVTTYEYLRTVWEEIENPYDEGACSNFCEFLRYSSGELKLKKMVDIDDGTAFNQEVQNSRHRAISRQYSQELRRSRSLSVSQQMDGSVRSNSIIEDLEQVNQRTRGRQNSITNFK